MNEDNDYSELIDLAREEFLEKYNEIVAHMLKFSYWYQLSGSYKGGNIYNIETCQFEKINGKKVLSLGRSSYYDRFMDDLLRLEGIKSYQSDYMMWIDPSDPYKSLKFYINTAEKIHFNIEGLGIKDILVAVNAGKATSDRSELKNGYMTIWEMNHILYTQNIEKTTWHINGNYNQKEIYEIQKIMENKYRINWEDGHNNRFNLSQRFVT